MTLFHPLPTNFRRWLLVSSVVTLLSCSTARPSQPPLIEHGPLAALKETAAYPNSQTALLMVTMQQFTVNHREWDGYEYFGRLAREQPQRGPLLRSLQAVMQVRVAKHIGLLKRVAWVDDAILKLDQGANGVPVLGRFVRGLVFAELPARFGKASIAVDDLEASLAQRHQFPVGVDRGAYRALALAYRTLGDDTRSRDMARRAGIQSLDDATTPHVLGNVSVDATRGFRFSEERLVREADDVYVAEGYDFSNISFIVTSSFVAAIDAGTTTATARRALAALRKVTQAPIRYVILTHSHWDHVGGLAALREPATIVIARAGFTQELERSQKYHPPYRYFFGSGAMELNVKPDRLIAATETLSDGELTLQLIPAKSGETGDALFVQHPKRGLLFVGDAFMPYLGAPFVAEGSPEDYLGAIAQVLELRPRRLIHGHPPLTTFFTIEAMPGLQGALSELYRSTLAAAQRGRPIAEVLGDNLLPATLRSAPAAVQPYLITRDNFIQRTYAQRAGYWRANGDGMDHLTRTQWVAALDALGVTTDAAYARAASNLEARGDARLALYVANLGLARFPSSRPVQEARQRALTSLRQMTAQTDPFRFIIYSELAGQSLPPMQFPAGLHDTADDVRQRSR